MNASHQSTPSFPPVVGNDGGNLKAALLSAGLGRRMEPFTRNLLPKPMFPLGGSTPIAELWVRKLVECGITDITMNLCVLGTAIKNHFGSGGTFGAAISYIEEREPSGTFGGICKMVLGNRATMVTDGEPLPEHAPFTGSTVLVASGDIVTNFAAEEIGEMVALHRKSGAAVSIILSPVAWDDRGEYGTVEFIAPQPLCRTFKTTGKIGKFYEKDPNSPSNLNNASIYLVETALLQSLDPFRTPASTTATNPFYDFGKHLFPALLGTLDYARAPFEAPIIGIEYDGIWFDVGRKPDYLTVNNAVLEKRVTVPFSGKQFFWGYCGNHVSIDLSAVTIIPPVIIGNRCTIEPGAVLGPYAIIGDDWTIGKDARITHSVLWPRYDIYRDDGGVIAPADRCDVDPHRVSCGVTIDQSIVAGGSIETSLLHSTATVDSDGRLTVLDINAVSSGPRA